MAGLVPAGQVEGPSPPSGVSVRRTSPNPAWSSIWRSRILPLSSAPKGFITTTASAMVGTIAKIVWNDRAAPIVMALCWRRRRAQKYHSRSWNCTNRAPRPSSWPGETIIRQARARKAPIRSDHFI